MAVRSWKSQVRDPDLGALVQPEHWHWRRQVQSRVQSRVLPDTSNDSSHSSV